MGGVISVLRIFSKRHLLSPLKLSQHQPPSSWVLLILPSMSSTLPRVRPKYPTVSSRRPAMLCLTSRGLAWVCSPPATGARRCWRSWTVRGSSSQLDWSHGEGGLRRHRCMVREVVQGGGEVRGHQEGGARHQGLLGDPGPHAVGDQARCLLLVLLRQRNHPWNRIRLCP